jgi:methyl-accepting chemotaxis protein
MLRDILSGARGMSPVVLTILIAWALLSVMFLTGTLLAARSIDRSVAVIKPNVDEIGTEAGFIDQARTIEDTSTKINRAAAPLTGHLAVTLEVASKGIDPKLKRILGKVGQINSVASEINGTVLSIGGTVDEIFGSASSIGTTVGGIGSDVQSIHRDVQTINASARNILSSGNSILSRVNSIDRGVTTIVGDLASPINTTALAIKEDFIGIDARVGQENRGGPFASTVVGHANSIDCSLPFDLIGLSDTLEPLLNPILGDTNPRFGGSGCRK